MSVTIVCPCCGNSVETKGTLLGKRVRCAKCGDAFIATSDSSPTDDDETPILRSEPPDQGRKAVASFVLGLLGLVGWCLPLIGLPMTITGLVMGIKGRNSRNAGLSIAGIVLNIIGLILTLVNAGIGAYLGATGQHALFPR